jgi:hypothetical protein
VLPGAVLALKTNSGDTTVDVKVKPGTKVAYWAAKPESKPDAEGNVLVKAAYDDFENSGVVVANEQGVAKLVFNKGTSYVVPSGRKIESHVHYREFGEDGMMGPVKSVFV